MQRILITGALGQIGSELVTYLRDLYGSDNVIATSRRKKDIPEVIETGPFEVVDATDGALLAEMCTKYRIDTIIHLAALLSATAEKMPQQAYDINMNGLYSVLEVAREQKTQLFVPSSIAAFGPSTPADNTPQDTIQRPTSMYGVTKVAGELLCDYYYKRFGVDTRGLRFPGIISYKTLPGGGTTDYAVDIFYEAIKKGSYTCFLREDASLDMMYMPDAIKGIHDVMQADPDKLHHRNAFNVTAMSFTPAVLAQAIQKHMPDFSIRYDVDPMRQAIADSWPNSLDDSCAREEWGWKPDYDLDRMTEDMLTQLKIKLNG